MSLILSFGAVALVAFTFLHYERDLQRLKLAEKALEASAIVEEFGRRSRRLEEEIIDQKVKLDVIELRMQNSVGRTSRTSLAHLPTPAVEQEPSPNPIRKPVGVGRDTDSDLRIPRTQAIAKSSTVSEEKEDGEGEPNDESREFSRSELEALRTVQENSKATARDIQNQIQKTREHTARLMNSLYKKGLVRRDDTARPFTYSLTEKGREKL